MPTYPAPGSAGRRLRPVAARLLKGAAIAVALSLAGGGSAARAADEIPVLPEGAGSVSMTIHGGATAVVRELRTATLPAGESVLAFPQVPQAAQAASVRLRAVDPDSGGDASAGLTVLERALAADVPTRHRLLELSVGSGIGVLVHDQGPEAPPRRVSATVLSVAEDVVLEMEGVIRVGLPGDLVLDALPDGLRATPTLLATVRAEAAGPRRLALTYMTGGLTWTADYALDLGEAMTGGDLTGWATLTNTSGRTFREAAVTLASGEVAVPDPVVPDGSRAMMMRAEADGMAAGAGGMPPVPEGQAQAGQHFYPLERPVTLAHRQTRQVALVNAPGIAVRPRHVLPAAGEHRVLHPGVANEGVHARRDLVLTNTAEAGPGRPLPAGTVRVWQPGPDGTPRFLGADRIGAVPLGAEVTLSLGTDADVTAERIRTDFRRIGDRATESDHLVVLRNGKPDTEVTVAVEARLPGDWTVTTESHAHRQEAADRVVWTVAVPAGGEARLTYGVRTQF